MVGSVRSAKEHPIFWKVRNARESSAPVPASGKFLGRFISSQGVLPSILSAGSELLLKHEWFSSGLTAQEIAILGCLSLWPKSTYDQIETRCRVARRTISPCLKKLSQNGHIIILAKGHYSVPKGTDRDTEARANETLSRANGTLARAGGTMTGTLTGTLPIGCDENVKTEEGVKAKKRAKRSVQKNNEWGEMLERWNDLAERFPNLVRARRLSPALQKLATTHAKNQGVRITELWDELILGVGQSPWLRGERSHGDRDPLKLSLTKLLRKSGDFVGWALEAVETGESAPVLGKQLSDEEILAELDAELGKPEGV